MYSLRIACIFLLFNVLLVADRITIPDGFELLADQIGSQVYQDADGSIIQVVDLSRGAVMEPAVHKFSLDGIMDNPCIGDDDYLTSYSNSDKVKKNFCHERVRQLYNKHIYQYEYNTASIFNTSEFTKYSEYSEECSFYNKSDCSLTTTLTDSVYINGKYFLGEKTNIDFKLAGIILYINNEKHTLKIEDPTDELATKKRLQDYLPSDVINKKFSAILGKDLDLAVQTKFPNNTSSDNYTAIGIADQDGDGDDETAIIIIAKDKKPNEIAKWFVEIGISGTSNCTINDEICEDMKSIWLDSGSSTQFYAYKSGDKKYPYLSKGIHFASDKYRPIPAYMIVKYKLFDDIPIGDTTESETIYNSIVDLANLGVITTENSSFRPDDNISRQEVAKMIVKIRDLMSIPRLTKCPSDKKTPNKFSDYDSSKWFFSSNYAYEMVCNGILNGSNNQLSPTENVIYRDFAKMVSLTFVGEVHGKNGTTYDWGCKYFACLYNDNRKILSKFSDIEYAEKSVPRKEVAVVLYHAYLLWQKGMLNEHTISCKNPDVTTIKGCINAKK